MYLESVRLENVKCFKDVSLTFQSNRDGDQQSNWNVIVGNNGDGKTSLLQAIAACLMDTTTAERLLHPNNWVRKGSQTGRLTAKICKEDGDKQLGRPTIQGKNDRNLQYVIVDGNQEVELNDLLVPLNSDPGSLFPEYPEKRANKRFFASATILEPTAEFARLFDNFNTLLDDVDYLKRNAFVERKQSGWVSCGYGAFRRISGFASHTVNINDPLQKRFLTLFEEGAALYDCESWLKELDRRAKKSKVGSNQRNTLEEAKSIVLALLPDVDEIIIADEVSFKWRGSEVNLSQLSDGYRSMFALAVDLLRWLELLCPDNTKINEVSGVVLIDEIDSHLHPRWQRNAGFLLTRVFPNIQFIVTTHSPFVVMAAGNNAITLLEKQGETVTANQDVPYVRGWAVDHVLTELFDMPSMRDPDTEAKLERYEDLRFRSQREALSAEDDAEFHMLETDLNTRLRGDDDSPIQKQIAEDLTFLASQLKQRLNGPSR
ncbi:MAG TPA: AAA family ATPase [Chthonomonadaceae bacterium]|nr:AAA family ATPase [Chthonomonadaceae bacterium]